MALLQSGILGEKNGPPARDPETMALLFDTVRRGVDFRTAPEGPLTVQWDFTDADAWHLRLDNGSTAVAPGRVEAPDIVFRARYEDFVDVVGGRLDPRRAMATGRLRPRGSLRTLWSARGIFGLSGEPAGRSVRRLVRERARGGDGDALRAGRRADVRHLHAAVLEDRERAEAAEQALGRDDQRAVAGGQAGAGGDRADRALEHELARGILDRAQAELARAARRRAPAR